MKPPKLIFVGPTDYKVRVTNKIDLLGETDSNNAEISLRRAQSPSTMRGTVIHELMHVIIFESGLVKVLDLTHDREEQLVSVMSPWVLAAFDDNPELRNALWGDS